MFHRCCITYSTDLVELREWLLVCLCTVAGGHNNSERDIVKYYNQKQVHLDLKLINSWIAWCLLADSYLVPTKYASIQKNTEFS